MMREKREKRFSTLQTVLFCVFGLVFLIGLALFGASVLSARKSADANRRLQAQLYDSVPAHFAPDPAAAEAETASDETVEALPKASMDFTGLKQINSDAVAWLYAEGTSIDYPVLQTTDNDYYLTHLYNRERNEYGSLFVDYRNQGDFSDRNTVIYGHHMRNGTMFGSLEGYRSQDFYEAAPMMQLYTPEGDYRIELICGTEESGDEEFVAFNFGSDSDFLAYVDGFRQHSTFLSDVELKPGDRIVSLCTCTYTFENARYVLIGKLVPLTSAAAG